MDTERKTIAELEAEGFEGCDVSLEISLLEYGMASRVDGTDNLYYYVVASQDGEYRKFDWSRLPVDCDMQKEFDWADLTAVASMGGQTLEEWLKFPQFQQVQDLVSYYGNENVFGSSYTEAFEIVE